MSKLSRLCDKISDVKDVKIKDEVASITLSVRRKDNFEDIPEKIDGFKILEKYKKEQIEEMQRRKEIKEKRGEKNER